MEKNMETTIIGYIGLGFGFRFARNGKNTETVTMGYIRTTTRIHSFIPS